MTGNSQERFGSNRAYGYGGQKTGTIVSIKDPENRGRVQVRFHGYNDAQGVDKDGLEWVHCGGQNSQIAGHTATHPYYAGTQVEMHGTDGEHQVTGARAGFDSEKRLSGEDPPQLDTSENTKPDLPNIVRGDKQTSVRGSPGLQPSADYGATKYFSYGSWSSMFQHMYPYSLGTGGNVSPYGQGQKAKMHQLKSVGTMAMQHGSDVLDTVDGMDDNFSGAFKPATKIIRNLRNNGYGNGIEQQGGQQIGQAEGVFNGAFGTNSNNANFMVQSLIALIQSLIKAVQFENSLTTTNLYSEANNFGIMITPCQNTLLNISPDLVTNLQNDLNQLLAGGGGLPTAFYQSILTDINTNFSQAMSQGSLNLLTLLNNATSDSNGIPLPLNQIVYILGGTTLCTTLAQNLLTFDNLVGIPQSVTYATCGGVIGLAILGKLNSLPLYTPANTAPPQSTDSAQSPASMSKWTGNMIAMGELMSGQLNNNFLTGIQKKYQDADRNHGKSVLKKHTDRIPNYSDGPSSPVNYADPALGSQMQPWISGQGYDA